MTPSEVVLNSLRKVSEIELSVKGRVSGQVSSRPVWFVLSKDTKSILLIPVNGRKTRWYLNVKEEPNMSVKVMDLSFSGRVAEVPPERFREVFAAFTAKYGKADMDGCYPRKEVAVEVTISPPP